MMNSKNITSDKPNFYMGICDECGEVYEAESLVQDLDGITFECKKAFCVGQVDLNASHRMTEEDSHFSFSDFDTNEAPKRFC